VEYRVVGFLRCLWTLWCIRLWDLGGATAATRVVTGGAWCSQWKVKVYSNSGDEQEWKWNPLWVQIFSAFMNVIRQRRRIFLLRRLLKNLYTTANCYWSRRKSMEKFLERHMHSIIYDPRAANMGVWNDTRTCLRPMFTAAWFTCSVRCRAPANMSRVIGPCLWMNKDILTTREHGLWTRPVSASRVDSAPVNAGHKHG